MSDDQGMRTSASIHIIRYLQAADGTSAPDWSLFAVLFLAIIVLFIFWDGRVRRCITRRNQQREDRHTQHDLDVITLEAEILRNTIHNLLGARHLVERAAEDSQRGHRKEYIANVLMTKKIGGADKTENDCSGPAPPRHHGLHASETDNEEDEAETCTICLAPYKENDEIAWSHNKHCSHVFHRTCISEWLLDHEECPCCRHYFLFFEEDVEAPSQPPPSDDGLLDAPGEFYLARGMELFHRFAPSPSATEQREPPNEESDVEANVELPRLSRAGGEAVSSSQRIATDVPFAREAGSRVDVPINSHINETASQSSVAPS